MNRLDSVYNPRDNNTDEITGGFNVEYRPANLDWFSVKAGAQQHNYKTDQVLLQKTTRLSCRTPAADTTSANNVVVAQVPCADIEAIIDSTSRTNPLEYYSTGDLGFRTALRTGTTTPTRLSQPRLLQEAR